MVRRIDEKRWHVILKNRRTCLDRKDLSGMKTPLAKSMTAAEKVRRLRKTVDSGQTCAILVDADPDSPSFKGSPPGRRTLPLQ